MILLQRPPSGVVEKAIMGISKSKDIYAEIDYSSLLLTNRNVAVTGYPFFHGCVDNYLPDSTYRSLPNRLVCFLKSKNSWHGVSPITCPATKSRKSLLITLHDRRFQTENIIHRMARSSVRATMHFKGYY
jgi:hypothetical protein